MDETLQDASQAANNLFLKIKDTFFTWFKNILSWDNIFKLIGSVIIILALYFLYRFLIRCIKKIPSSKLSIQRTSILIKIIKYSFYVILVMFVVSLFGVKLSAIWGAAGIAGIALGFAAQTSISNLISGIFVLSEGILKIGDYISVSGATGIVDEISLLSIKIHTLDNQLVRIPNSSIISSNLTNTSFYSDRRIVINVSVSYDTDMNLALQTLSKAPTLCPTIISTPPSSVWFESFGDSGINLSLAAWFKNENLIQAKNELFIAIKQVFDEANISIPYNKLEVSLTKD